jgi:iron(III) transport system ATP-binding protein
MTTDVGIRVRGLEKRYGDVRAVDHVDLAVPPGAFLVLLGPSGCGKTTILRMLAGLEEPTGGEIHFGDQLVASGHAGLTVAPGQRDAGLVFQSYALWPHMSVRENVAWPLKVKGWSAERRNARVREVLDLLSIGNLIERYPGEISGGQQQRVAIARTIAPGPKILLFDEPLSNLDAKLRAEMRTELLRVHRLTGATSVYVTHDQVEAMTMASHVAVMAHGRVEQFGAPDELLNTPATRFVATFIGTPPANVIPVEVVQGRYCYKQLDLGVADQRNGAGPSWLMYRADALLLRPEPSARCLPVEFAEATPVAGRHIVTVWESEMRLNIVTAEAPRAHLGDRLFLEFPAMPAMVYHDKAELDAQAVIA